MRWLCLAFAAAVLITMSGCAAFVFTPAPGFVYTDVKYPGAHTPRGAVPGPKVGKAEAQNVLGIVATGDASIQAAARNGQITRIATVEHHAKNILGVYATWTTIVTGE